ncbi:hypothetical protein ACWC5I_04210 [Kitasatospora sp. NPDC001574]
MSDIVELDPEDKKIITLARSARARNGVAEGAAVRDETGRTYVAGTVALESLRLSAVQVAVAMAVASGARSLEAAAVVSDFCRPRTVWAKTSWPTPLVPNQWFADGG